MVPEIFLRQEKFFGVYNGDITKLARYIKWNARNHNDQNLYNPVIIYKYFLKVFYFFQKKAHG